MPKYNREYQLGRLIGLWPHEIADNSEQNHKKIIALLEKAIRGERKRGLAGHWTYDVNRHLVLLETLRQEKLAQKMAARRTERPLLRLVK